MTQNNNDKTIIQRLYSFFKDLYEKYDYALFPFYILIVIGTIFYNYLFDSVIGYFFLIF